MNDELYHHGVEGMSWGKRNGPPYPLNAKGKAKLRAQKKAARAEKKETSDNSETGLISKKKTKEQPVKSYKNLNETEIKTAKEDAIRKGNIKEAYKNREHYTDDELKKVKARYELNTDVKEIVDADIRRGAEKVNAIADRLETVNRLGNAVAVSAANIVKIYNAVGPFASKANGNKKFEQIPTDKLAQYQSTGKNKKKK